MLSWNFKYLSCNFQVDLFEFSGDPFNGRGMFDWILKRVSRG